MTDQELLQHLHGVDRRVEGLPHRGAVGFGLLCTERQWPVFVRAVRTATWAANLLPVLRQAIDGLWESMSQEDASMPSEDDLPDPILWMDEGGSTASDAVAYHILNAVVDFVSSIREGDSNSPVLG